MKSYVCSFLLVAAFVAVGLLSVAADDIPKTLAFARYEAMTNRSPFAVASAAAAPSATPNFAKDLYIANAARTSDGDLITLASSTDKNFKKYLSTKAPVDGYSVLSIDWSERVGETKVTIGKDGQTATLTFNQALLSQSGSTSAPPPPQPQPQPQTAGVGVPPVPQYNNATNFIKPAPIPTLPTPPPRVRGVIPRNPGAEASALSAQPQADQKAIHQKEMLQKQIELKQAEQLKDE